MAATAVEATTMMLNKCNDSSLDSRDIFPVCVCIDGDGETLSRSGFFALCLSLHEYVWGADVYMCACERSERYRMKEGMDDVYLQPKYRLCSLLSQRVYVRTTFVETGNVT